MVQFPLSKTKSVAENVDDENFFFQILVAMSREDSCGKGPLIRGEITKLGEDLKGKTIYNGKVFSFRYVKPGDTVEFRFYGKGKRRWEKVERVIRANPQDDHSKCVYFGVCGGCSGQHIAYEEQFRVRTERLLQLYKDYWDLDLITVPAERIYGYRNRMDFTISPHRFGLREQGNFRKVVDIEECLIQSDWANEEWKRIREYLKGHPELPQDRQSDTGFLKYITLRKGILSRDTMVIFTFSSEGRRQDAEAQLESWLLKESLAKNIVFCYNSRRSEVSACGEHRVVRGNPFYREILEGKEFLVPFDSFFQPNPLQFRYILSEVRSYFEASQKRFLLDLFCGIGFFSVLLGDRAESILGIDSVSPAVDIANQRVREAFPGKWIDFRQKDLMQKKQMREFSEEFQSLGIPPEDIFLILDPPRNGAGRMVLDWVLGSGIESVVYVSCNPKKQWEEMMSHLGKEFVPIRGLITDPYPHTPHLESVLFLKRKKGSFWRGIF